MESFVFAIAFLTFINLHVMIAHQKWLNRHEKQKIHMKNEKIYALIVSTGTK